MSSNRKVAFALAALLIALVALTGCVQPEPVVVEREVEKIITQEVQVVTEVMVTPTPAPAVQGGAWVRASLSDASILNPILGSDSASSDVYGFLFPGLLGVNPFSGAFEPTEMAESWTVSEDGLTWTFNLRDGVVWSDGDPVDAADFKYTYDAIASELVETPRKSNVAGIESIEVLDPLTLQVVFGEVKCDGLGDLGLGWLPSHLYAEDFSDIMENSYNEAPPVSSGPFVFNEWVRDDNTTLLRNDTYFKGAPNMDGMIYRIIPDPGARLAALQTGEVDQIGVQPEQLTTVQLDPNLNLYKFKDDGYSYIALNLANPENPQPGQDEEGNLIEQDPHPILSDKAVRQAIAHSLDYDTIISKVYLGQGYKMAANVLPAVEWAYDPAILPYDFNTEMAAQMLEDAGWVDTDGDGVREKDGQILALNLLTNAGNTTREDLGVLVQDQLNGVGFDITFEAIDFGTMVGQMLGQTYDMVIIGWTGLGTDPNDDSFWHSQYDTPDSGFNFVSYNNARIDELLAQGVAVPGCDPAERAPFYQEIQQIIHDDVPYVFVSGSVGNVGYSNKFEGLDPGPWSFYHNVEQWSLTQ